MTPSNLPIAYPFVPPQQFTTRYTDEDAIMRGTLFPELDLPFQDFHNEQPLPKTPLTEVMTLDFVCHDLRLYLDIHTEDTAAAELLNEYEHKAAQAKYELAVETANSYQNAWVNSPWPWEGEI
ncbi:MAG: spore coat associated protein CotJA [Defluviitaleaceae bacterium]|nr:spore coat associated protein CotJA [Defluviitaleaceae bacterium]